MQLGFTIPLMKHLRYKSLPYGEDCPLFYCWDLHRILLHGQGCLLAVHADTRYTFVVFGVTQHEWQAIEETFLDGLQTSLERAGFAPDEIATYLAQAGEPERTKTHGRRPVAFLNQAWNDAVAYDYCTDTASQNQPQLELAINSKRCRCAGCEGHIQPIAQLRKRFDEMAAMT